VGEDHFSSCVRVAHQVNRLRRRLCVSSANHKSEEVEKVNPDLVIRDAEGKVFTVRYEAVNAMLLNEFLKEHRKVQDLQKQVERLTAGFQKVSDELDLRKSAMQVVDNTQ
jgi:hypothetical protein